MAVVWILMTTIVMNAPSMVFGGCSRPTNPIFNKDGGYSIQIAIKDDINEDPAIIDGLREMLTEASSMLFKATKNYVYFHSITILVPSNWTRGWYEKAQQESYENAHVYVTPLSNDKPYVTQTSVECGCPGMFMHFTPNYLINKTVSEQNYGKRDKMVVRLWAMLRWGVFLENYDEEHNSIGENVQPFYQGENGYEGTRCSASILGDLKRDGDICKADPFGALDPRCRFVPSSEEQQTATGSLMFDSGGLDITSISDFCHNNASLPEGLHNRQAPNLQNLRCSRRSVWEVMLSSDDFSKSRDPLPPSTDTMPEIKVVQHGANRWVALVLDSSGSMDTGDKLETMRQAATHYLMDVLPTGSSAVVLDFNYDAIASDLVRLVDSDSRNQLIEMLPTYANGATCIGCGIEKAIEVLQENSKSDSLGAYLILVTDGEENRPPYIRDTLDLIDQSGVIIDTIALTEEADPQLTNLSMTTGGMEALCSIQSGVECVMRAFENTVTGRSQAFQEAPVLHHSSRILSEPQTSEFVSFPLEPTVGRDMTITVTWVNNDVMSVTVRDPDGDIIDDSGTARVLDTVTDSKMTTIRVPEAQAGEWSVEINNPNNVEENVGVSVSSKPLSNNEPVVVVNTFLESSIIDYDEDPTQTLYAYIHINQQAVLEASVTAQVESATGDLHTLQLYDDGKGGDLFRGDGIYSAYYLIFTTNGRYGVKIDATGSTENTQAGYRFARDVSKNSSSFSRTASAGVFEVINYVPGPKPDITAPSMIADFRTIDTTNRTVTVFGWTAVGDDLDQGTASHYELRYSTDYDTILDNWATCIHVSQSDLLDGRLSPVAPAGTDESVTLSFPGNDPDVMYFYAIRAVDESSNAGGLSNILRVVLPPLVPVYTTTDVLPTTSDPMPTTTDALLTTRDAFATTQRQTLLTSSRPADSAPRLPLIIGILIPMVFIIVMFFLCILRYQFHYKHGCFSPPQQAERIIHEPDFMYTATNPVYVTQVEVPLETSKNQ